MVPTVHLAQMNFARMKAPLDSELMASFVARVDESVLVNVSVWESVGALKDYAYRSQHAELYRRRHEWFEQVDGAYSVLWWIPAGHVPTIEEAKERLAHLQAHGPSAYAFGFKTIHQPESLPVSNV